MNYLNVKISATAPWILQPFYISNLVWWILDSRNTNYWKLDYGRGFENLWPQGLEFRAHDFSFLLLACISKICSLKSHVLNSKSPIGMILTDFVEESELLETALSRLMKRDLLNTWNFLNAPKMWTWLVYCHIIRIYHNRGKIFLTSMDKEWGSESN